MSRKGSLWLVLAFVTIVFLASNWRLVFGRGLPRWDAVTFYAPAQMLVADHARQGKLLLWNPWIFGGSPDCADVQVGAFSPLAVGVGALTGGTIRGFVFYWLLSWWWAGLGIVLLARHLRAPPWGAILVAVAFLSSGFFAGHAQHTSFISAFAFLPLIIWRCDVALRDRSRLAAAQAGALWGLAALAGYPGFTILNSGYVGLWAGGRLLFGSDAEPGTGAEAHQSADFSRRLRNTVTVLILIACTGLLVMAPTYYAFFTEGRGYSDRVEPLSRERAVGSNALHPGATATFASSHLAMVKLANRELWSYSDPSMVNLYLGASAVVLALCALGSKDRFRWWLLLVAVFFLLAAMGRAVPLRGWLFDLLPPMRFFRHSAILRSHFIFTLAVLALFACRDLARESHRKGWLRFAFLSAGLGALALVVLRVISGRVDNPVQLALATQWAALFWLAPAVLAVALWRIRPGKIHSAILGILVLLTCADSFKALALTRSTVMATDRISRGMWEEATKGYSASLDLTERGLQRKVKSHFTPGVGNVNAVIKEPVLNSYSPFKNYYVIHWLKDPLLTGFATGDDRIWFAEEALELPVTRDLFTIFQTRTKNLKAPVLLLHPETAERPLPANAAERRQIYEDLDGQVRQLGAIQRIKVEVESYRPNELRFRVDAPADGWLFVTDRYATGWRAWQDGEPKRIWRANFMFRAVKVDSGSHVIRFKYRPAGFPVLLMTSWCTLALVLFAGLRQATRKKEPALRTSRSGH